MANSNDLPVEKSVCVADNRLNEDERKNITMILLLDVGNSFIKWVWLEPAWLKRKQRSLPALSDANECLHAGEEMQAVLDEAWLEYPKPQYVWCSNVAGESMQLSLQAWIKQHWNCPVSFASTESHSGQVINAYVEPSQMGVDRWLGLLAANASGKGAKAVIDCGTAVTVDALSASGQHLGGLILPGLKMMRDSLFSEAQGIAETEQGDPVPGMLFANNTSTAVEVGCHYSIIAFIERVIADMKKEMGEDLNCILTGGDAEEVLPLLSVKVDHQALLILQGLAVYANRKNNP